MVVVVVPMYAFMSVLLQVQAFGEERMKKALKKLTSLQKVFVLRFVDIPQLFGPNP